MWWQKVLIGVVATIASVSAVMAIRLWLVERAFDHMQRQVVESTSRIQQQVQASTQRMLADQQRRQEARQVLEQAKRYIRAKREFEAKFAAGKL